MKQYALRWPNGHWELVDAEKLLGRMDWIAQAGRSGFRVVELRAPPLDGRQQFSEEDYEYLLTHPGPDRDAAEFVTTTMGVGDGRRVLDFGCGIGTLGALLVERGWKVTGVECNPVSAELASIPVVLVPRFAQGLPLPDDAFDLVVVKDVLEYLVAGEHLSGVLAELVRLAPVVIVSGEVATEGGRSKKMVTWWGPDTWTSALRPYGDVEMVSDGMPDNVRTWILRRWA